jgi:hypothetical protein
VITLALSKKILGVKTFIYQSSQSPFQALSQVLSEKNPEKFPAFSPFLSLLTARKPCIAGASAP